MFVGKNLDDTRRNGPCLATSERCLKKARSVKAAFPPLHRRHKNRKQRHLFRWRAQDSTEDECLSTSFEVSDSESLPDLSDVSSTCSTPSAVTPTRASPTFLLDLPSMEHIPKLVFPAPAVEAISRKVTIFDVPELVYKIIEYADIQNTVVPNEVPPIRRKPLSMNHATLIYGDEKQAQLAMARPEISRSAALNVLHTCLLVNKLFHRITKEIMSSKVFFSNGESFKKFIANDEAFFSEFQPKTFVLNKLFYAKQPCIDRLARLVDFSKLEWLELYMCPRLDLPPSMYSQSLKRLVVTGSRVAGDQLLVSAAQQCPNLEVLDIRACEHITDFGIYSIGQACLNLRSINFGRKHKGRLITSHSVASLVSRNPNLHTIGLAGCHIDDRTIWEIAMSCGDRLERLLLNNCPFVTDQSLPKVLLLNLLPNMSVLEMRFMDGVTNLEPVILFKRQQSAKGIPMLVETCEKVLRQMQDRERQMDSVVSQSIFRDISEWANSKDEEDEEAYDQLVRTRMSMTPA